MVTRQFELDEETDQILASLAEDCEGGLNQVVAELARSHAGIEDLVEQCEEANSESLRHQRDQSNREFLEGKFTTWEEVKRRNGL